MEEESTEIALLHSAPPGSWGAADKHELAWLTPESLDVGVDIGDISRTLGLDPSTVRLNGHLLGVCREGGGGWVSSVTWRSLLEFFSSRGHHTGAAADPIRVQGKVRSPESYNTGTQNGGPCTGNLGTITRLLPSKRKSTTQQTCQAKKSKSSNIEDADDGSILCLKRKLRLESENQNQQKRPKAKGNFLTTVLHPKVVSGLRTVDSKPPSICNSGRVGVTESLKYFQQRACSST